MIRRACGEVVKTRLNEYIFETNAKIQSMAIVAACAIVVISKTGKSLFESL